MKQKMIHTLACAGAVIAIAAISGSAMRFLSAAAPPGRAPSASGVVQTLGADEQPAHTVRTELTLLYLDAPLTLDAPFYLIRGRLYLPCNALSAAIGTEAPLSWSATQPAYPIGGEIYRSLYDVAQTLWLTPVFDTPARTITLYHAMPEPSTRAPVSGKASYLRLEDIMADYGLNGRFDDEGLEKLRAQADYLHRNGQRYYIAWIPVYVNPQEGIINDLTRNFGFYNAQFLYTLDDMTDHGGVLIAHGLTHQSGESVSADGTEFGADTPFTEQEIRHRMEQILATADFLGYRVHGFEFPHYASTPAQEQIAAAYFPLIYQQDKASGQAGRINTHMLEGRQVSYLPTPQDYVISSEKKLQMLRSVEQTPQDRLVSLFFHPSLDRDAITLMTDTEGVRYYTYDQEGFLPQLLEVLAAKKLYLRTLG